MTTCSIELRIKMSLGLPNGISYFGFVVKVTLFIQSTCPDSFNIYMQVNEIKSMKGEVRNL